METSFAFTVAPVQSGKMLAPCQFVQARALVRAVSTASRQLSSRPQFTATRCESSGFGGRRVFRGVWRRVYSTESGGPNASAGGSSGGSSGNGGNGGRKTRTGGGGGGGDEGGRNEGPGGDEETNIFKKWWRAYERLLVEKPLLTKSITSGVIQGAGDIVSQLSEGGLDMHRLTVMTATGGAFVGPVLAAWYSVLFRLIPGGDARGVLGRVAMDQLIFAPIFTAAIFTVIGLLEGKSPGECKEKLDRDWWTALKANWKVWPAAQLINMKFVPQQFNVLFVNLVAVGWNAYISNLAHKDEPLLETGANDAAEGGVEVPPAAGGVPPAPTAGAAGAPAAGAPAPTLKPTSPPAPPAAKPAPAPAGAKPAPAVAGAGARKQ